MGRRERETREGESELNREGENEIGEKRGRRKLKTRRESGSRKMGEREGGR